MAQPDLTFENRQYIVLQTCCNILQHCNTLNLTHCTTLHHTLPHWTALHHTAPHRAARYHATLQCNTLQHTASHCNKVHHAAPRSSMLRVCVCVCVCVRVCTYTIVPCVFLSHTHMNHTTHKSPLWLLFVSYGHASCVSFCACICACVCMCVFVCVFVYTHIKQTVTICSMCNDLFHV